MRTCEIHGCQNKHLARGMCRAHYLRKYKRGSTDLLIMRGFPTVERILAKTKREDGGCLIYTGKLTPKGYAHVRDGKKMRFAHVIMWEKKYGPVPNGRELDHLCRRRNCVETDHLEPVTHQENCSRGISGHDVNRRRRDVSGKFSGGFSS